MSREGARNATPLSAGQVRTLARAVRLEVRGGLPCGGREQRRWRRRAAAIPDPPTRHDALSSLGRKRGHTDGAVLLSTLVDEPSPALLRLLAAYEIIWDFLDNVNERCPSEANGRELHLALLDAVDVERPLADHYRHHPWKDDGGYLVSLVEFCRRECRGLPSYDRVRHLLVVEARRAQVLALNHIDDARLRDTALRRWAEEEFPGDRRATWFELSGAASASLVVHALLALAARRHLTDAEIDATHSTYWPWMSLATTMLDSFVDQREDAASGDHSYVTHYPSIEAALSRMCACVGIAAREASGLPGRHCHRHRVILAAMIAMYLSKDSGRSCPLRRWSGRLAVAGGSTTRLLLPVLRAWRLVYSQRAA